MTENAPASLTGGVLLREVRDDDLPIFFSQQLDKTANQMAAFTAKDPADRRQVIVDAGYDRTMDQLVLERAMVDWRVGSATSSSTSTRAIPPIQNAYPLIVE